MRLRTIGAAGSVIVSAALAAGLVTANPALASGASASGSPTTGLHDGSVVAVTGHGFPASTTIYLVQCSNTSGQAGCDTGRLATAQSTASGDISGSVTVHTGAIGNGTCAATSSNCFIGVSDAGQTATAQVPLSFSVPGPSATGTPSSGLTEGATVALTGKGFPASGTVYITQCANASGQAGCNVAGLKTAKADASGNVRAAFPVHLGKIGNGTCTATSTTCFIAVSGGTPALTAVVPVTFAKAATALSVKLAPAHPTSSQTTKITVTVTAKGFIPTGSVAVLKGTKLLGTGKLGKLGKAVITLAKRKAGSYPLTVKYGGSVAAKASSKTITLKVAAA